MVSKSSGFCVAMGILGFVLGVMYACTLILIPVAVYCFIGAKYYMDVSALTDSQITMKKQILTNWAIFFSIVGFPIGLISIFPAYFASSNNVTITSVSEEQEQSASNEAETITQKKEESVNQTSPEETIEKLEHLYKEGLITKEELERAKAEVLNK